MSKAKRVKVAEAHEERTLALVKHAVEMQRNAAAEEREAEEREAERVRKGREEESLRLLEKAKAHAKRVMAARALIGELDDYTDACVIREQTSAIVDILVASAMDLSFNVWCNCMTADRGPAPGFETEDADKAEAVAA